MGTWAKRAAVCLAVLAGFAGCSSSPHSSYTPTTIYFNPSGSGFYDMPFPNDYETDPQGHPLLTGFPNPAQVSLLDQYLEAARTEVTGFGTNSPLYLHFTGSSISLSTLPQTPADSLVPNASMYLVDIDPSSARYGERVPLQWSYQITGTDYMPSDTLAVLPVYGFPLRGATQYALVLTTAVEDINRHPIALPQLLRQALESTSGNTPELVRLIAVYQPFVKYLQQQGINRDTIGAATVFTTQDPTRALRLIRQVVSGVAGLHVSTMAYAGPGANYVGSYNSNYEVFGGTYTSTNFQAGVPPDATAGGNFTYDANGTPVIQRWESMDFSLTVPYGTQPAAGWPLALYAHGTGGDHTTFIYDGTAGILANSGIACIGIDQPLHGTRVSPPLSSSQLEIDSFNFFNPDEGRTNFRQSAVDSFVLTRLIKSGGLFITAGISPVGAINFNTNDIVFVGHSQGGLTGTLFAALEPGIKGAVLSGDGGDLALTIIYRKDPIDIQQTIELLFGIPTTQPITAFHPLVGLVQLLVEVTDPINYGSYLINPYDATGTPKNIVLTEGMLDLYTPPITTEALAVASGIPLVAPVAHPVDAYTLIGLPVFTPPVSADITASNGTAVTAGLLQFPYDDHYAIFTDTTAQEDYSAFLQSLAYTGTAVIP